MLVDHIIGESITQGEEKYVRNPELLCSYAPDHVGCMKIYLRLSKFIVTDKQVLKKQYKYHRKHIFRE